MPLIEWNEQWATKMASIDRQHKTLVGYINKLHDANQKGDPGMVLGFILNNLINYTKVHFSYEEMLFRMYDYPEEEDHKIAHKKLFEKVGKFKSRFEAGDMTVGNELLDFLKLWLNNHILKEDMAYSQFFIDKGVK